MDRTKQGPGRRGRREEDRRGISDPSKREKELNSWVPKTVVGRKVKDGEIASLDVLFDAGYKILEPEVVDFLLADLQEKLVEFKKTTRVTRSGRVFSYRATVLIGDQNRFIGLSTGKDKERYPALRKAAKNAKIAITRINKGCGSWECGCNENHSVPFKVNGKSSSVRVELIPAPKGTGLVVGDNIKDVLKFVGIRDVWCKTFGNTGSKLDFVKAAIDALNKTVSLKYSDDISAKLGGRR